MPFRQFGKAPAGKRLERILRSPNYRDGQFQNLSHTPALAEGVSYWNVLYEFLIKKQPGRFPTSPIPSMKADLLQLLPEADVLVWFGHSSYFMQIDGKRILVDPVFSGNASPISGTTKAFPGSDRYTVDDLPPVDYLFISHDHYDHFDYKTLVQLRDKVKLVICGLGVGSHLEFWGYDPDVIIEEDWNTDIDLGDGFTVHTTPARHFSGRTFKRNNTLWMSYVLRTPTLKIFIGGDSGYDTHFKAIGKQHGPFDLAILENGQYDPKWRYIHTLPDEFLLVAQDLQARRVLPVHSGKFALANHRWDEPLSKVTALATQAGVPLTTPMIGELVYLNDEEQHFSKWWESK